MSNAWYEVLSVLHLMAMLLLSQANLLLLPRTSSDGYQPKVSEGRHFIYCKALCCKQPCCIKLNLFSLVFIQCTKPWTLK